MFNSIGWGEILILVVIGLVIFGPDRLPQLSKDAAKMLRQVRNVAQGARTHLKSELGPEFGDLDFDSLNPKSFVRKHLLEDFDDPFGTNDEPAEIAGAVRTVQRSLGPGEAAPFDSDAT